MKLALLRVLAVVGVVALLTGGYAAVGFVEGYFLLRIERDALATRVEHLAAVSTIQWRAHRQTQARLTEACRMLPFQTLAACLTTIDVRLDRRARRVAR